MHKEITFQSVLSLVAVVTTVSQFFCGIPICVNIWRRKSTDDIASLPFITGFLGGCFWLRYGILINELGMIVVNVVGVSLMITYLIFYTYYTKSRKLILVQIFLDLLTVSIMVTLVHLFGQISREPLGFVSMSFNIINFGSPLAGLAVIFRTRNCETMPLPMCIGVLLVSSQWCLYGFVIHDKYLIVPNGAGVILALIQISLFLIFPSKTGNVAPLGYCCPIVRRLADSDPKHAINDALKGNSKGIWNIKNKVGDISAINGSHPVAVSLGNGAVGTVRITVDEAKS